MSRIEKMTEEKAQGQVKTLYSDLKNKMHGRLPNIFLHMGNSPEALQAFATLLDLAGKTSLSPKLREKLALAIGETNHCNYCVTAHTAIGKSVGLSDEDIFKAKKGTADDKKTEAILSFAKQVIAKHGAVTDQEVDTLKAYGISDKEICEIMLIITLNIFTNYFNKVVDTKIDF